MWFTSLNVITFPAFMTFGLDVRAINPEQQTLVKFLPHAGNQLLCAEIYFVWYECLNVFGEKQEEKVLATLTSDNSIVGWI